MKLKYVAYEGRTHTRCILTDIHIGSTACGKCKGFVSQDHKQQWVECSKADNIVNALRNMTYREPVADLFKYRYKDELIYVDTLDDLVAVWKLTGQDVNDFMNHSNYKFVGGTIEFGIGDGYTSTPNLRQYLFNRELLKAFLDKITK